MNKTLRRAVETGLVAVLVAPIALGVAAPAYAQTSIKPKAIAPVVALKFTPPAPPAAPVQPAVTASDLGQFKITCYSGGGITATGTPAHEGEVAVDPSVIPLETMLSFDGQTFQAQDTGGAVLGNHIDMYNDSNSFCDNWGVKYFDVTKLAPAASASPAASQSAAVEAVPATVADDRR